MYAVQGGSNFWVWGGAVYYAVQVGTNFCVCGLNPEVTIQMKATE